MSRIVAALDRIRNLEAKIDMMGHNGGPSFENDDRELIPDAEAAYSLGVSVRTLIRWDNRSELDFPKPVRVNGRRFRRPVEIAKWVAKRAKAERRPKPHSLDRRSKPAKRAAQPRRQASPTK
jgi:predicted DNA-binding transcriptional regulator AlpA